MKLVPLRSIVLTGLILLILSLVVINIGSTWLNGNQDPTSTNNASLAGDNASVEVFAQDTAINNPLPALNLLVFIGFIVFIILANLSYLYVVNTSDVIQLVQTSIKLAGFSIQIKKFGREWKISENITLTLHGGSHPLFHLQYKPNTRNINPRMYGLAISEGHISQNIDPDSLQLTMQSFHRYLVAEATI